MEIRLIVKCEMCDREFVGELRVFSIMDKSVFFTPQECPYCRHENGFSADAEHIINVTE